MFYLEPDQLSRMCSELCDKKTVMPFFQRGVIKDKLFAQEIHKLHYDFENPQICPLEKESRFYMLFSKFILKYAKKSIRPATTGLEPKIIMVVKEYIHNYFDTTISLSDLSRRAGVSKFYLLRVFAKKTGMTPHAYLNHVRVSKARQMMQNKVSIIDTAMSTGFYDQSHLNRIFKRICGITPGQYVGALQ